MTRVLPLSSRIMKLLGCSFSGNCREANAAVLDKPRALRDAGVEENGRESKRI